MSDTNDLIQERLVLAHSFEKVPSGHLAPCALAEHHGSTDGVAGDVPHRLLDRKLRRKD